MMQRYGEFEPRMWSDRVPEPNLVFALWEPGSRIPTRLLYREKAGAEVVTFEVATLQRLQDAIDPRSWWVYVPRLPEIARVG